MRSEHATIKWGREKEARDNCINPFSYCWHGMLYSMYSTLANGWKSADWLAGAGSKRVSDSRQITFIHWHLLYFPPLYCYPVCTMYNVPVQGTSNLKGRQYVFNFERGFITSKFWAHSIAYRYILMHRRNAHCVAIMAKKFWH